MEINFQGPVTAGSMNVAGRDVNVGGDINAAVSGGSDPLELVQQLRDAIGTLDLPAATRRQTTTQVNAIEKECGKRRPDKSSIADKLGRLTKVLTAAGAVLTAGTPVVAVILGLATWLGEHGKAVIGLLPH